jgi:hypothetical protein
MNGSNYSAESAEKERYFKKHMNPSWSSEKPSLASKVLEIPLPFGFA